MPLVNPYAKKASSNSAAVSMAHALAATNSAAVDLLRMAPRDQGLPSRRAATFSQVFESITESSVDYSHADAAGPLNSAADASSTAFDPNSSTGETGNNKSSASAASEALLHQHSHALYVSTRQKGNGVLNHIRNVPICFIKMSPDFCMSSSRCALFLSCKYHELHPDYIHGRIDKLDRAYALKVLLVLVDLEDCSETLLQLNCLAVEHNLTLVLSWSEEEAARYLETLKAFDGHDASIIKKREETNFVDQVASVLAECKGVNKTDSQQLLAQFGNFRSMVAASMDELALVPGVGEVKVKRLHDAFHKPFSRKMAAERKKRKQQEEATVQESLVENDAVNSDEERELAMENEEP